MPDTNADSVLDTAGRFSSLAASVDAAQAQLATQAAAAVNALDGPRAMELAEASGPVARHLQVSASQLDLVTRILRDYAVAVHVAHEALRDLRASWDARQQESDTYTDSLQLDHTQAQQNTIESAGEQIQAELRQAMNRAATALDDATKLLTDTTNSQAADETLRRALNSWSNITQPTSSSLLSFYADFKQWTDPVLNTHTVAQAGPQSVLASNVLRNWKTPHEAAQLLERTTQLENLSIDHTLKFFDNNADSYGVLRQYFLGEEAISLAQFESGATEVAQQGRVAALHDAIQLGSKFAKLTAILGVISGAYDSAYPQGEGWVKQANRGSGIVSVGAGGYLLAAGITGGAIAGSTVFVPLAGAALLITAIWGLSNLAITINWDEVRDGLGIAWQATLGALGAAAAWNAASNGAGAAWDASSGAADAAWDGVTGWIGDRFDDIGDSFADPGNWL